MQKSHDKIAARLALILTKLNAGEKLVVETLAEEFGVGVRTIQRDLNERLVYLPIKKENNCYSLESYALGKLNFDDIQNFAALSGISGLFPSLTERFLTEVLNGRLNPVFRVNGFDFEELETKSEAWRLLSEAIRHQSQIRFTYHEKERTVYPYKLVNTHGIWYLAGDENGTLKNYSFSKISGLQILESVFEPNPEFVGITGRDDMKWFSETTIEVTLEVDGHVSEYFLRRSLLPNQTILSRTDEKMLLSTKASYEDEILSVAKYWLPHVRIVSPAHLQEKLNAVLGRYLETTHPVGGSG